MLRARITSPLARPDGAGVSDNNIWYVGGAYAFSDMFKAGLTYIDEGEEGGYDLGKTITLYGSYATGPANSLRRSNQRLRRRRRTYTTDTAFGIGGSYDLGGGVSLLGGVHRDYAEEGYGELGCEVQILISSEFSQRERASGPLFLLGRGVALCIRSRQEARMALQEIVARIGQAEAAAGARRARCSSSPYRRCSPRSGCWRFWAKATGCLARTMCRRLRANGRPGAPPIRKCACI